MNKIYDAIMGLVVGDAIGVPVEFKLRDTFVITDMIGYGTHNQPAGTWSDDSSMTLATLESIGRLGKIDPTDIMQNFQKWLCNYEFTPYDEVFDVGKTTQEAICRFVDGASIENCGGNDYMDNGNGSLMRILPLVFCKPNFEDVSKISGLTHNHPISRKACMIYLLVAHQLLNGKCLETSIKMIEPFATKEFSRLSNIEKLRREEIISDGYVVHTLEAALWCLINSESYTDCVLMAVNLGGDTDTTAAVAGGLAGILYGTGNEKGIPKKWIEQIAKKDWIEDICNKTKETLMGGRK